MTNWSIFADDLGPVRRIEIGVKHVLLGSNKLRAWTGGNIVCGPDSMARPPGFDGPVILVSSGFESGDPQTSGELLSQVGISVSLFYDEPRHAVEDTEATVKSVVHEIDRALWANYYLRVAYFGEEQLTDRIVEAETVVYDDLIDDRTGDVIGQRLVRGYLYEFQETAATGAKA